MGCAPAPTISASVRCRDERRHRAFHSWRCATHAELCRSESGTGGQFRAVHGISPVGRKYADTCTRFVEGLGSLSAVEANRTDIRVFLSRLLRKGLASASLHLHSTAALRAFYRFIRISGLTAHDPTLLLANRKISHRLPRVLSVAEVEALINAARDPLEQAVPEVLYSTGCRVSELVGLELKNVDLSEHVILLKRTKGRTDRYVPFGQWHAAKAPFGNTSAGGRPSGICSKLLPGLAESICT